MMKTYAFELSGEHETLPRSEALSLVEAFSTRFSEVDFLEQCLIVQAESLDVELLARRLAMTRHIIEVLAVCPADLSALAEAADHLSFPRQRYLVRARRIRDAVPPADAVEREVGRVLFAKGYRADLSHPETRLRAIISSGRIVLGLEVARTDRSSFEYRRPHLKPFFHPGVLMPRMARALVNLTQAKAGEVLLDPFAGTCGILIEACLIEVMGMGVEVQHHLVKGAICNLQGLDCGLLRGDAKRLPLKNSCIDAAVLDTPYGRSAKIMAQSKELLINESLCELFRVIRPGRRMAIVADRPIEGLIEGAGFVVLQKHTDRVHRSLTRHIFICRK